MNPSPTNICCCYPAKPAAAPGMECTESICCGLCPGRDSCNSKQPCRKGWDKRYTSGDDYFDRVERQL